MAAAAAAQPAGSVPPASRPRVCGRPWAARHVAAALMFTGMLFSYALRVLMSITIGPMALEFGYDQRQKGVVLAAFFIGYILPALPSGAAATRWGGKPVLLIGITAASAITLVTPWLSGSYASLVVARALCGLAEGVIYPTTHALLGKWAPASERSAMVTLVWSGAYLGTTFTLPIAGGLSATVSAGWRSVFYLFGVLGLAWCLVWWRFAASSPELCSYISDAERSYIIAARGVGTSAAVAARDVIERKDSGVGAEDDAAEEQAPESDADALLPDAGATLSYCKLLSNPSVLAIAVAHACHNFQYYMLLTWLPEFLREQLQFDVDHAGALAVLPYFACFVGSAAAGPVADRLIARTGHRWRVRVVAQLVGEVVPALALAATGYVQSASLAVLLLTISLGIGGVSNAGFGSSHLDVCPQYAGVLLGFTNTVATIPGIISPMFVGAIVAAPHNDLPHWRMAFHVAAGISVFGAIVFALFARAHPLSPSDYTQEVPRPSPVSGSAKRRSPRVLAEAQ